MISMNHASRQLLASSRRLIFRDKQKSFLQPTVKRFQHQTTDASKRKPFWSNEWAFLNRKRVLNLNISEVAGNLSSFMVVSAYLMTDIFALRVMSLGATALSVVFQYYRQVPLWIPIRWNCLLFAINSAMVTKLHLERQRAGQMSQEMQNLYLHGKFEERGFSKVEFLRLHELAEMVTLPAGHEMVKQGQVKDGLHFLVDGTVKIRKNKKTVARLDKYNFIGEVSLLGKLSHNMDTTASADVIVSSQRPAVFLKWNFDKLIPFLREDREVFNALAAYLNHDLTAKLLRDGFIRRASTKTSVIKPLQAESS